VPESTEKKATEFRVHDVGRKGRAQRLSALIDGKWQTVSWHMHKDAVYVTDNTLASTDPSDQKILDKIREETGQLRVDKILLPYQIKKMKKGGWFSEQYRHQLARKGIKTGRKKKHIIIGKGYFSPIGGISSEEHRSIAESALEEALARQLQKKEKFQ
jgi:hypothetical protein